MKTETANANANEGKGGPYPLEVWPATEDGSIRIVTAHGNLYARTFDPSAARLIASAPELLAACEALLRQAEGSGWPEVQQARAAIAKAKGIAQ